MFLYGGTHHQERLLFKVWSIRFVCQKLQQAVSEINYVMHKTFQEPGEYHRLIPT